VTNPTGIDAGQRERSNKAQMKKPPDNIGFLIQIIPVLKRELVHAVGTKRST
jgi:hypothetical protein